MNHGADPSHSPPTQPAAGPLIASRLHTIIVVAVLIALAYGSTLATTRLGGELHPHRIGIYLIGIGEEWFVFALVIAGLRRARTPMSLVIGERWHSSRELLRDIGIAAGFWLACLPALHLLKLLFRVAPFDAGVMALIPHGAAEIALWIGVSVSAGICEETVFRGYLQRQLMAMTGSRITGLLLSAIAFGLLHLYQGWRWAGVITLYGVLFGALAYWRGTVRPGMIAHAWQDTLTGVLLAILLKR